MSKTHRNPVARNPLMKKGHRHERRYKSDRRRVRQKLQSGRINRVEEEE